MADDYSATITPYIPYVSPQQTNLMAAQTAQDQASAAQSNAQTGYIGAQTTGANIQNQGAQMQFNLLQKALSGGVPSGSTIPGIASGSGSGTPGGGDSSGTNGTDSSGTGHPANYPSADDAVAHAQNTYGQLPVTFTPQEQQYMQSMRSTGNPLLSAQADAFQNARVQATQQVNAQRQYQAQQKYSVASDVAAAPEASAFTVLQRYSPDIAKGIAAQHPADFTTDSMGNVVATPAGNADAAAYARTVAASVYPHTGRESAMVNGQLIDVKSGKPVPGIDQVMTGLDAAGKDKSFEEANTPVDTGAPQKSLRYQVTIDPQTGRPFTSALAYVMAADRAARSSAATNSSPSPQGNTPPASPPQGGSSGGNLVASASSTTPKQNAVPGAAGAGAVGPTATAPGPAGTSANTPSSPWSAIPKIPPALTNPNSITTPILKAQSDALVKKDSDMRDSIQETADNGNNRLQLNADAARALPNAATGPGADWLTAGRKFLVQIGAASPDTAQKVVDTTTLNKDLTQNALQSGKLMFGSKYTESEVGLMLTKANASGEMTPQAIHELLLQDNLRSQYAVQKQADYEQYTSKGGDPRKFDGWYNTNFSLQKFATQNRAAADAALKQQEAGSANNTQKQPTRPGQQSSGPAVRVNSRADAMALKPGTVFTTPDGRTLVR
jgi:hypothetical protein